MRKLLALLVMVAMLLPSCQKINDRIDGLEDRIDQIEGTQIATINQQIEAINTTLPQLRETDAELKEYIQSLQTTATNLQEQITNTNKDIDELEAALNKAIADAEASDDALKAELVAQLNTAKADILAQLESTKTALEAELNQINSTIATLQAKDTELEGKITTLEEYVNTELQNTEDWATATFATLEQYNTIVEDIATIKTQIETLNTSLTNLEERLNSKIATDIATAVEGLQGELATKVTEITTAYTDAISTAKEEITAAYTEAIATAIANLESSMKEWVNEQLAGYYTIAEVDAALDTLQNSLDEDNKALQEDIEELSTKVDNMKAELTDAYTKAIEEAINTNNGVIDGKIAEEIAAVNGRIDSEVAAINARIDALEERIEDLEEALDKIKALDIVFDIESGKACMAGASIEFGYTIVGGDEDSEVESFGDRGWGADVIATDATSGRIRVTAPKDGGKGKVVVLATSGAGGTCMKSIRFDEGILTDILDTYKVDWEACTLEINPKTNIDYDVRISEDAQSWLSVAKTRAEIREDRLIFSVSENPYLPRTATIELIDNYGFAVRTFEIHQKMQPREITLVANSTAIGVGETVEFTVLCENMDITSEAIIYDEYFNEIPNTYVPFSTGKYKFFSVYETQRSTQITVSVLPCSLEIPIDTQPNNLSFNHRALAIAHVGTNAPTMKDNILALDDSSYRYNYNIIECHGGSYATNDPARSDVARILDDLQNPNGYPSLFLNLYNCEILNADTSEFIYKADCALDNCIKKEGADVGISMAVASLDDEVYCRANIKSAKHDEYRVNAWLLENNIYAANQYGAYKIYDHALRNVSEEVCSEDFAGLSIGLLDVGSVHNYSCSIPITNASWDANNMEVLIVVCAKDENGMWEVANSTVCPVNSKKSYEYVRMHTLDTPVVDVTELTEDSCSIQWNSIDNAVSYFVYVNGEKIGATIETYYTISNLTSGDHTISVKAVGNEYYDSAPANVSITIEYQKVKLYIDISATGWSKCFAVDKYDKDGDGYMEEGGTLLQLTPEDINGKQWYVYESNTLLCDTFYLLVINSYDYDEYGFIKISTKENNEAKIGFTEKNNGSWEITIIDDDSYI